MLHTMIPGRQEVTWYLMAVDTAQFSFAQGSVQCAGCSVAQIQTAGGYITYVILTLHMVTWSGAGCDIDTCCLT